MSYVFGATASRPNPGLMMRGAWSPGSEAGGLAELLRLLGANASEVQAAAAAAVPLSMRRVGLDETLFHEGGPADAIHFVRAGTFKLFRTAEDGYEQVLGFAGRAEVLGFEALAHGTHPCGAVALEDSSIFSLPLRDFFAAGRSVPALDLLVHRSVSSALARRGELADLMAAVAAEVRLARFLLQLSQRMAECAMSPRRFHLRMGRRDIASYIGVAHETVSRAFSSLARWGLVAVHNREVEIVDVARLRAFAMNTRRQIDECGAPLAPRQRAPLAAVAVH
jgi:CRP/FNR family transcriptional regulator